MAKRGVNKVTLVGNLGQDPEVKFMPSGDAVANFTVATSEVWKDKQTGEQKEKTEWHRVAIFGKLAEIAGEYLKKGSKVYLEGKLQTRKWQNQQGQDQYTTEVVLQGYDGDMQMLDSRGQGQGQGQQQPQQQSQNFNQGQQQAQRMPSMAQQEQMQQQQQQQQQQGGFNQNQNMSQQQSAQNFNQVQQQQPQQQNGFNQVQQQQSQQGAGFDGDIPFARIGMNPALLSAM